MRKHLLWIVPLIVSIPLWLPSSLGGDTSYNFVLTNSMKGRWTREPFWWCNARIAIKLGMW